MMAYQPEPRTRFRSLVLGQYVDAHAMSPSTALTLISVRSGVSLGALWSAFRGFRVVTPHVGFNDRMTLNLGERTLELIQLKNIHSDADTAIWPRLPRSNASAFCARS